MSSEFMDGTTPVVSSRGNDMLQGIWTYADSGAVIQYTFLKDRTFHARSVMTVPNFPRVEIETAGSYETSGDTVVLTPQSSASHGKPGPLINVTGRYDAGTGHLLLKPSTSTDFRVYSRGGSIPTTFATPHQPVADSTLPGALLVALIASCVLTLISSFVIIARYKQSARRAMAPKSSQTPAAAAPRLDEFPKSDLLVREWQEESPLLLLEAQRRLHRIAVVYSMAGLGCTVVLTLALLLESQAHTFTSALVFLTIFSWPVALCWSLIAGWNSQARRRIFSLYAAVFVAVLLTAYLRSPANKPLPLLAAWALVNVLPTILIFAFSASAVRSIGPCILALTTVCIMGTWVSLNQVQQNLAAGAWLSRQTNRIGTSSIGAVSSLVLLSAVAFFALGWLLIARIVRNYSLNKTSDQSIQLDSLWLLFAFTEAIFVCTPARTSSGNGFVLAMLAFPVYWMVRTAGLWWLRRKDSDSSAELSLLYLRRFRLGGRTERLFRSLTLFWRLIGDVRLIGGSDLARSTLQPQTLLNFLRGTAGDSLISSAGVLSQQLNHLPPNVDPDTRFRVVDFLCADHMWQDAVTALMKRPHVVLADFRGFTFQNEGALYEIKQILELVPLTRVLILTDTIEITERVSRAISYYSQSLATGSPNYQASRESLKVILQTSSAPETLAVLRVLFSLASPTDSGRAQPATAH